MLYAPGPPVPRFTTRPSTTTSSAASGSPRSRVSISTSSPRSAARTTPRPPALPPKISNWPSMPPTPPPTSLGQDLGGRARQHPAQDRRPHRGQPRTLAYAETVDNGKPIRETLNADIPLPSTTSATSPAACARRKAASPRSTKHRRLPLPRAARRRRPDHPVELPDPDGRLEARPGPRRRQLRGAQAGRIDPDLHPDPGRTDRRPAAAGRAQHRQRLRPRSRHAARHQQAHRQDRLHRLHQPPAASSPRPPPTT
jgi:hypothetical protein